MSEEKKIKLTEQDWEHLAPIREVSIASQKIIVRPLGFVRLTETLKKFRNTAQDLVEEGVTIENYNTPENLLKITITVLERMPEVLSDCSNLDQADIERLPINVALLLVEAILDANIESQNGFLKNFTALATKITAMMGSQTKA